MRARIFAHTCPFTRCLPPPSHHALPLLICVYSPVHHYLYPCQPSFNPTAFDQIYNPNIGNSFEALYVTLTWTLRSLIVPRVPVAEPINKDEFEG
jgi:hypothetical protein